MDQDLVSRTKERLEAQCYRMNQDWLEGCVQFYMTASNGHSKNNDELIKFVKEQWLLSDLREINNHRGSLPPNLKQHTSILLPKTYILQMEAMYDISRSKYEQREDIRKSRTDAGKSKKPQRNEEDPEVETAPRAKRVMSLQLTDGVQEITGMEYRQIRGLQETLLPGSKLMIIGPVWCRRGVLLLEETNVKGIGGEVENLLISNAPENIFNRALGFPENPDPYGDAEQQKPEIENKPGKTRVQEVEELDLAAEDFEEFDFEALDLERGTRHEEPQHETAYGTKNVECRTRNAEQKTKDVDVVELSDSEDFQEIFEPENFTNSSTNQSRAPRPQVAGDVKMETKVNDLGIEDFSEFFEDIPEPEAMGFRPGKSEVTSVKLVKPEVNKPILTKPEVNVPNFSKPEVSASNFLKPQVNRPNLTKPAVNSPNSTTLKVSASNTTKPHGSASSYIKLEASTSNKIKPEMAKVNSVKSEVSGPGAKGTKGNMRIDTFFNKGKGNTLRLDGEVIVLPDEGNVLPVSSKEKRLRESPVACSSPKRGRKMGELACDLIQHVKNTKQGEKTVLGKVEELGKLLKKDNLWTLDARISDGSGSIEVCFSNEVLEKMLGFSVQEFSRKKKLKNDPKIENELRMSLRGAELKLKTLHALLNLEFSNAKPRVTKITELTEEQRSRCEMKLENYLLSEVE